MQFWSGALAACLLASGTAWAQGAEEEGWRTTGGWSGLRVERLDGASSLSMHVMMRARAELAAEGDGPWGSSTRLANARTQVLFRHGPVSMMFQPELAGTPRMIDARVDLRLSDVADIGGGLMIVPFTRSWLTPLPLVASIERAPTNGVFAPGPRRLGGTLEVHDPDRKVQVWAGLFDPTPIGEEAPGVPPPGALLRVQANPLGSAVTNEIAAASGPAERAVSVGAGAWFADDTLTGVLDVGVQGGGFTLVGEGFLRSDEDGGASLQVGQMVVPRHLMIGARGSRIVDGTVDGDTRWVGEAFLVGLAEGGHLLAQLRGQVVAPDDGPATTTITLNTQARF